ncbi:hypothetical protein Tco_1226716 [Tanacetum coccineum]
MSEYQTVDVTALPKFDMPSYESSMSAKEGHIVDTKLPILFRVIVLKKELPLLIRIAQHTTPPLSTNQPIPDKTDHQKEVEVEDPKIVAIRERKAKAAAKKRENKRRGGDEGEGSRPQVKRMKASAARKEGPAISGHVSSPKPIRTVDPTRLAAGNPSGAVAAIAESREDRTLHNPPHDLANRSVHNYADTHDDEEANSLRLGSFIDQSDRNLTAVNTEVFEPSPDNRSVHRSPTAEIVTSLVRSPLRGTQVKEGESSRSQAFYVPEWFIHQRCRVDTLMWCRELMVHLAPPAAQEESNALNNATALERAWFNLAREALAQTEILERFEHLQADYDKLDEIHSECEEMVRKLVQARLYLEHNAKLYNDMADRYRRAKSEHDGYAKKLKVLEGRNSELSQVNRDQALRIKELEDKLAKKDFTLVYAERISAKKAQEKEELVAQLSQTEMEKFYCIRKLLPTMVSRIFHNHEYKQSLSEPFNFAIQAGWAKGLAEECFEEDLLDIMGRMENFDAYVDKKMYVEYDKLFEKRYPFVKKISRGFCHMVTDLLKFYPDPPPSGQAPTTTVRVSTQPSVSSTPKKT